MPYHYDEDKKKKRRVVETDPAKKAWKALQSGGLDPMPFDDDFDVYEAKKHLKEEVKGMGPEGKRFLKDKLSGKKYEGKLKPKFKKDLLKELEGMSSKGKSYVKKELGEPKNWLDKFYDMKPDRRKSKKARSWLKEEDEKEKEDKKETDKPLKFKGPDWLKPKEWDSWSEKKKEAGAKMVIGAMGDIGQSIGKGLSDKDMKSYVKKEKGDVQKGYGAYKPEKGDSKSAKVKALEALKKLESVGDEVNIQDSKLPKFKHKKGEAKPRRLVGQLRERLFGSDKMDDEERKKSEGLKAKPKVFGSSSKKILKDLFEKSNKRVEESLKKKLPKSSLDKKIKFYVKKEKGDSKNWIKDAVKKPGALRATAKREGLIKGDELLSSKDLDELKSKAKKSNNALLMRRVNLAKTFKKMKK